MKLDIQRFASGTVYGSKVGNNKNAYMRARVDWTATAQGSEANYSLLSLTLFAQRQDSLSEPTSGWYWKGTVTVTDVNGTKQTPISFTSMGKSVAIKNGSWTTFKSASNIKIPHNNDGTGTATIYLSLEGPKGCSFAGKVSSGSGTITLDTIPRASGMHITNTSNVAITEATLGDTIRIHIDKKSTAFTHDLLWIDPDVMNGAEIVSKTTADYVDYKLEDILFLSRIPGKSKSFMIFVATKNSSGTQIGDAAGADLTIKVPNSYKPTLSIGTLSDVNANASINNGVLVKGKSTLKVPVTFTSHDSYTELKSYTVTVNGETFTGTLSGTSVTKEFTCSRILGTVGTFTINASVTDNRGNSNSASKQYTVQDYFGPSIKISNILRANDSGIAQDDGTRLLYNFTADVKQIGNNKPTFTVSYRVNEIGSAWNVIHTNTSDFSIALSNILVTNIEFSADKEYYIKFSARDSYNESVELTYKLDTGFDIMNINAEGTAVAFGKKSTASGTEKKWECAMPAVFDKAIRAQTIQNMKNCAGFGGTGNRWQRICIIKRAWHDQGSFVFLRIHIGAGNNGGDNQNAYIDLSLQQGYTGSNDGRYGGNYILYALNTSYDLSTAKIKVKAINNLNYEVWLFNSNPYCRPCYSYDVDDGVTIEHDGQSFSTSEPTGTFCNVSGINPALAGYPIGAIYMSKSATNPQDIFGGTWTAIKDRVIIGAGGLYGAGTEGGSKDAVVVEHAHYLYLGSESAGAHTHKIQCDQDAQYTKSGTRSWSVHKSETGAGGTVGITSSNGGHTHIVQGNTNLNGVSGVNANLPPYKAYYIWERTA